MSPDSATRFGSASVRTRPRCSSALISTSIVVPPAIMRPSMKPNGDVPESTPAATSPTGMLVGLVGAVIGRLLAGWREPILAVMRLLNTFHCTPSSRPAWREASTKRTSSMTCCGDATVDRVDDLRRELRAIVTALVERDRVRRGARQHDAAVDRRHLDAADRRRGRSRSRGARCRRSPRCRTCRHGVLPSA